MSRRVCYTRSMADDMTDSELARLRAENERLKRAASRGITIKVSEKGGVSVYGLGRFPVTLYKEQWTRLLDMAEEIRAFIRDNETSLKTKRRNRSRRRRGVRRAWRVATARAPSAASAMR